MMIMKKQLLLFAMILLPLVASAHDIEVHNADGVTIYYNYINDGKELAVTFGGSSYKDYSNEYQGNVVIPEEVTFMNRTRKVTSIGDYAFYDCSGLTSVTIPNSVTSIGNRAFYGCSGLTSIEIRNSVTSIGERAFQSCYGLTKVTLNCNAIASKSYSSSSTLSSIFGSQVKEYVLGDDVTSIGSYAFYNCSNVTSVTIADNVTSVGDYAFDGTAWYNNSPDGLFYAGKVAYKYKGTMPANTSIRIKEGTLGIGQQAFYNCTGLTSVTIPNSVTSIGNSAFRGCYGLTSVTIGNSVTSIGSYAFSGCTGLTSVTIPNSVTSIGEYAFSACSGLTSITIPNSVTSIGNEAFNSCYRLTSVTIPNSVTSIGFEAFANCSGLTSVTIGSGVTRIGDAAFNGADIPTVISLIENPFTITGKTSDYSRTFSQNTFNNATLYVPKGTIEKYKATDGWKDFVFIEEGNGSGGDTPTTQKCEKPTISYQKGKLTFSCATDGATCQYTITDTDIKAGSGNEVQLGVTYNINVYASKLGYENSETATATLCWIDQQPKTEGITNGIANIPANAVLIQSEGSSIKVQGVDEGTQVNVYGINGTQAGSAVSQAGAATINTNLQPGSIAIVKIGEKGVKVMIK